MFVFCSRSVDATDRPARPLGVLAGRWQHCPDGAVARGVSQYDGRPRTTTDLLQPTPCAAVRSAQVSVISPQGRVSCYKSTV